MILTRSPHYITTPFVSPSLGFTCGKYKLELYVWSGLKNDVPASPTYSITINNPTGSTGNDKINISRLINDAIDFTPLDNSGTDLLDSPNQVWVKTLTYYALSQTGSFLTNPENEDTQLAITGYGGGLSGENPDTPTNKILMRLDDYTMSPDGKFIVPIELDETVPPTPSITITAVTEFADPIYQVAYTAVGTYASFYAVIEPDGEDAYVYNFAGTTSPENITITFDGDVDITMYGYDSLSNTNVVSNTFNFTTV
jgi:hypothetical protein